MAKTAKWTALVTLTAMISHGAVAQTALDRADPRLIERTLPNPVSSPKPAASKLPAAPAAPARAAPQVVGVVRRIVVEGGEPLPADVFAGPIAAAAGRELNREDIAALAGTIAQIARARGYPFATAQVPAQPLRDGVLRVALDLGRIDAVRVIGGRSATADRILAHALANGRPVRQHQLERALLLAADVPGVRVVSSKLMREDGFGILLVTIETDRASAYLQVDNRGSSEVGPIRLTALGSVRSVVRDGDELTAILSQTPLQPSEFTFLRARYGVSVGNDGMVLAASGSLARTRPGGLLRTLDVRGRSADAAVSLQYPLLRSRAHSLWLTTEMRALGTDQDLLRRRLRRDRITTIAATLGGNTALFGGTLRGDLTTTTGLPLAGTTRAGSRMGSRFDGDARFVTGSYLADWTIGIGKPFSLAIASAGQLASRPLLAASEIGLGGPGFARGYDYAERTGDKGVMGSAELRADFGAIRGSIVDRGQAYAFFDGGVVGNLRGGAGGGSLASTGLGLRLASGRFNWMVEAALPLTADRFDTGDRRPRLSARIARTF